ncbi:glycosyl transferase family 25 [Shinella sp. AETb1-6]|uniref:glycosyltransferase family 25 protein n=1 Tax=Shinella TaxID=323620 RepID=UPI00106F0618|nr:MULTISPECIES: glycosyltransferase family 25 protein [Shinella]MCD1266828.1 glycosyl transferase family 25 [Shinella sumterensis]MXN51241.1 glycosyl transferase family 25 [Shinella sp. AETb1-6]TFE95313.1 glycosyl transferase family 25 [Shinella sumterensis]
MSIRIYAINLDRSVDRWRSLSLSADAFGFDLVRISGVDGAETPPEERIDCDSKKFKRNNGRGMLPGEYGCYRSHLGALATFYATGELTAVIVEDDIKLSVDLVVRADAAIKAIPDADVVKLCNHRVVGFKHVTTSEAGDEIGRAVHGPQGSAACYVVTRKGAKRLLEGLNIMEYPWDVALERGWAYDAQIYTTRYDVAAPGRDSTTIATSSVYRSTKFPWWKRFRTYAIRIRETICRIGYARNG